MDIKIALAGNPNCGKTTMFNQLTGSSQYVGNWPGVTVEKKEGKLKGHKNVKIIDLPGIYSLSPYTLEEVVTRNYLINEKPDVIINIVDSTNIERNLYLTSQLSELGIPIIIALNMVDVVRKSGDNINIPKLANSLGCEIIETSALKGEGCFETAQKAIMLTEKKVKPIIKHYFSYKVELCISEIEKNIYSYVAKEQLRWYTVKLFEHDKKINENKIFPSNIINDINKLISACEKELDDDGESIIINERYTYVTKIVKYTVNKHNKSRMTGSDKIDRIVTNRFLALPIFALIMWAIYFISISTIGSIATDWVKKTLFGEFIYPSVENILDISNIPIWLNSLILDGIIDGVGSVLGFLPQMIVLFFFLSILEDCGYMSRVAFIMDKIFRKFGLSGKSFIPMLIGTGCSVPGIMASRTIENVRDRRMTIITTSFIPCGAKLPVIALIAGAMFNGSSWIAPAAYFIGIASVIISGLMLKKTHNFVGDPAPFVMELPSYHLPDAKSVFIHVWDRVKSFVIKAGTVIFLACSAIWFLSTFDWSMNMVGTSDSMLSDIGRVISPLFAPLGWGDWKAAVSTITGFIAKENIVGTFGVLYGHKSAGENSTEIWTNLQSAFTQLSALSFLIFNLLCAPCVAAIGAIRREMGNAKWTLFAITYQTLFAYAVSMIIYQFGSCINGDIHILGLALAFIIFAFIIYMLFRPYNNSSSTNIKNKKITI